MRYRIETVKFHDLQVVDEATGKTYGMFTRFERKQLQAFIDDLNGEDAE